MKRSFISTIISVLLFSVNGLQGQIVFKSDVKYLLDSAMTYNFNSSTDSILSGTTRHLYHWSGIDSIFTNANYDFINKTWIKDSTTTFIDSLGRDTTRITIDKYGSPNKYTTSYNQNGRITSKAYYAWSITHWYGIDKSVFELDSLTGDSTETVFDSDRYPYSWDFVNWKWGLPHRKYSTKYNANGTPSRTYWFMAVDETGNMALIFKNLFYYNSQNKVTLEDWYYSKQQSYFDWTNERRINRSYDSQGNMILYSESVLRTNYNYWSTGNKKKCYYKNNVLMSECNLGSYDTLGITNRTNDSISYSYNNKGQQICKTYYVKDASEQMQLVSKTYSYYSLNNVLTPIDTSNISAIEEQNQFENILVYPNPASDKLYISSNDYESKDIVLFSSNGQEISRYKCNLGEQEISLNGVVPGFYLVKITSKNQTRIYKIVIK